MTVHLQDLAGEDFCYLTTTGRISGRPHTIEIWFALHDHTLYMLSGGLSNADWVKNITRQPQVSVRIQDNVFEGQARVLSAGPEDALARRLVAEKYEPTEGDLYSWYTTALPVAVDLHVKEEQS